MSDRPKNAARAAELRRRAAIAAGRTPGTNGRPAWRCRCGSTTRAKRGDGSRKCTACFPVRKVGRPKKGGAA